MENAAAHALQGKSVVIYDLEIKEPIDGKTVTWSSFNRMGISVGVAYDYRDGDYHIYLDENLPALVKKLMSADLVVGFNQKGFDNNLLRATVANPLLPSDDEFPNYDILEESRRATGWRPGGSFPRGLKLDDHLRSMFGDKCCKTGNGELAPILYQNGKFSELITYCLADVRRTKMVFEEIWSTMTVRTAVNGNRTVRHPLGFMKNLGQQTLGPEKKCDSPTN